MYILVTLTEVAIVTKFHTILRTATDNKLLCIPASSLFTNLTQYSSGSSEKDIINQAAKSFGSRTDGCVRMIPRTTETAYVAVQNSGVDDIGGTTGNHGCWSYVGKVGRRQPLNLAKGCIELYIVQHEFLHALGTHHEQNRPDR